jgi:hypothetical protein
MNTIPLYTNSSINIGLNNGGRSLNRMGSNSWTSAEDEALFYAYHVMKGTRGLHTINRSQYDLISRLPVFNGKREPYKLRRRYFDYVRYHPPTAFYQGKRIHKTPFLKLWSRSIVVFMLPIIYSSSSSSSISSSSSSSSSSSLVLFLSIL